MQCQHDRGILPVICGKVEGVVCDRNILNINANKVIELFGFSNQFANNFEALLFIEQESHLSWFNRQVGIQIFTVNGAQDVQTVILKLTA